MAKIKATRATVGAEELERLDYANIWAEKKAKTDAPECPICGARQYNRATLRFFLRQNLAGTPYVAVKAGLLLRALLMQQTISESLCAMLSDTVARLERTRGEYRGGEE